MITLTVIGKSDWLADQRGGRKPKACPCCEGEGVVTLEDHFGNLYHELDCAHCEGSGDDLPTIPPSAYMRALLNDVRAYKNFTGVTPKLRVAKRHPQKN